MQKDIYVVDYRNPKDAYWEETYKIKGFRSYATGGKDITFYAYKEHDPDYVTRTLCHEGGHFVDTTIGRESNGSLSERWAKAAEDDIEKSGENAVSDYAKNVLEAQPGNYVEDFADSCADYIVMHGDFAKRFPNRTEILKDIIGELE